MTDKEMCVFLFLFLTRPRSVVDMDGVTDRTQGKKKRNILYSLIYHGPKLIFPTVRVEVNRPSTSSAGKEKRAREREEEVRIHRSLSTVVYARRRTKREKKETLEHSGKF